MNKKTKTILFTSLIVTMILSFSGMNIAQAEDVDKKTNQELKNDVKEWIKDKSIDKKSNTEKSIEVKTKYDILFRESIEQIRIETMTDELSESEIKNAMEYIFQEVAKIEKLDVVNEENSGDKINVEFLESIGVQTAQAVCLSTTHPTYKQLSLDINGGTFGTNSFNGNNDLISATYTDNTSTCVRTYTLTFTDEDHPTLDVFYDRLRQQLYHRTTDIETFGIKNNNQIIYDGTFSSTCDYDGNLLGCHNSATQTYTPGNVIYVSNTWNHMMSNVDTNTSLTKVTKP